MFRICGTVVPQVLRQKVKMCFPMFKYELDTFTCYVFLYDGSFYFTCLVGAVALLEKKNPKPELFGMYFTRCSQDC